MNTDNIVHLDGCVAVVSQQPSWTRYKPGGRGQVRFWLAVSRAIAGMGVDIFLCAIEPRTEQEIRHYEEQLRPARRVTLTAEARTVDVQPNEKSPGVIFVAEECAFDGAQVQPVHPHKRHRLTGKMAAAGEHMEDEPLFGIGS